MSEFSSQFLTNDIISSIVNQDGSAILPEDVKGKIICFYFSASWCPPCRALTPELAKKYDEIKQAGHQFEIVFVSADEDEESAKAYYAKMPWKMLDYSRRDAEQSLSSAFEIQGIPTLVLLNTDGTLMTTEGRELIMTKPFERIHSYLEDKKAEDVARLKFKASSYFAGKNVHGKDGESIDITTFDGKLIGLYFSAHWCPPCRGFTPKLAAKYLEIVGSGHPFEIIFVSSDRDEASAAEYFNEQPWKMLNFADRETKASLSRLFKVSGIPTLVLVNDEGLVTDNGREAVMGHPFEKWTVFEEEARLEQERLKGLIGGMPESVVCPQHEHPLKKLPQVYRGQYGCDICSGSGAGWVYHCNECGFDAHPLCVVKQ